MTKISQNDPKSQELIATLVRMSDPFACGFTPPRYRLKAGSVLGTICTSPVDAIEIDDWPITNVVATKATKAAIIAEYATHGAQIYAEGLDIEVCANEHIVAGYRAAQLAEVA